ncbi:MAG TPA: hypothetical protein VL754_08115 [Verrucomicrobiae bacterium]|jgi:hypothetical protein|nr:hypothetical protein [Verrucomicrobiae bacterium]
MPTVGSTWMMALRCQSCRELFTVKGIPSANIGAVADTTQCPNCSHEPEKPHTSSFNGKHHLIVTLEREKKDG